jgi:hypothetical protein
MTNFTTLTELQILNAAYTNILERWVTESERNDRLKLNGKPNRITQSRVDKLRAQIDELHEAILKLEQSENA